MEIEAAKRATRSDWSKYPNISPEEVEQLVSEHYEYKLLKIEALAEKWCNTRPSPYADAHSDWPLDVHITRTHGRELKTILSDSVRTCPKCNGSGQVEDTGNHLAFTKTCELCDGAGKIPTNSDKGGTR